MPAMCSFFSFLKTALLTFNSQAAEFTLSAHSQCWATITSVWFQSTLIPPNGGPGGPTRSQAPPGLPKSLQMSPRAACYRRTPRRSINDFGPCVCNGPQTSAADMGRPHLPPHARSPLPGWSPRDAHAPGTPGGHLAFNTSCTGVASQPAKETEPASAARAEATTPSRPLGPDTAPLWAWEAEKLGPGDGRVAHHCPRVVAVTIAGLHRLCLDGHPAGGSEL